MVKRWFLAVIVLALLWGCHKDETALPPQIHFVSGTGLTSSNTQVAIGAPVRIAIEALSGSAAITNIRVSMENEQGTEVALDSGLYAQQFQFFKTLSFGASSFEKWTITVMDKNRLSSSVSLVLSKDPNSAFGPIKYYPSIILGMQYNPLIGSFLATSTGQVLHQDSASQLQTIMNFIAYYGDLNVPPTEYTLSSPNETDAPKYFSLLPAWTQKTEIRYKFDSTSVSPQQFLAAYNDSIILANYTGATQGKRKFKRALPGYVVPFQIATGPEAGKRGLVMIKNVAGNQSGTMEIALKIQP